MFGGMGNWGNDGYKPCPVCGRQCDKFIPFRMESYWRCKVCKIDADDPKYSYKKKSYESPIPAWDDEQTDPTSKMSFAASVNSRSQIILDINACKMGAIMTSRLPSGVEEAEVRIYLDYELNGTLVNYVSHEKFAIKSGNSGSEDDMWVDLHSHLNLPPCFDLRDIKVEYCQTILHQKYPGGKITVL